MNSSEVVNYWIGAPPIHPDIAIWIQALFTIILVLITGYYAIVTNHLVKNSREQILMQYVPVLGVKIKKIEIGGEFGPGRRQLHIDMEITNIGNAPAINVLLDAEIQLQYSNIDNNNIIPSRFEPESIPFILSGNSVKNSDNEERLNYFTPGFGNSLVYALLEDFKENERLNLERKENNILVEYKKPKLSLFLYYQNSLSEFFKSTWEVFIDLEKISIPQPDGRTYLSPKYPEKNESVKIHELNIPRPIFSTIHISKENIIDEIEKRNLKRDLSGW